MSSRKTVKDKPFPRTEKMEAIALKPFSFVALVIISVVGLVGIFQISLVQDLVTNSGFSTAEVFSGIATLLAFVYAILAIFTVKA